MRPSISLRRAIQAHPLPPFALAKLAGVSHSSVSKFLRQKNGLGMEGFDKLCLTLGLILGPPGSSKPRAGAEDTKRLEDPELHMSPEKTPPIRPPLIGGR